LKSVLLHRPSHEVENLTPEILKRLLFDDIQSDTQHSWLSKSRNPLQGIAN